MKIREFAKAHNHEIIGKLKRLPDMRNDSDKHYPLWIDEVGNEYWMSENGKDCECIVTFDGGVI